MLHDMRYAGVVRRWRPKSDVKYLVAVLIGKQADPRARLLMLQVKARGSKLRDPALF